MDKLIILVSVIAITGIEIYALSQGINGLRLGMSLAVIGGLGGWKIKDFTIKRKKDNGN